MRNGLAVPLAALALAAGCGPTAAVGPDPSPPAALPPPIVERATAPSGPTPEPLTPDWQVRGLNLHRDPVGTLRVFLEITPAGGGTLEGVQVTIQLLDFDGAVVGERTVSPLIDLAIPGRWIPVVASFAPVPEIADQRLEIQGRPAEIVGPRIHPALSTREVSYGVGEYVALEVTGIVVNPGSESATNLRVVATCYDVMGRVVAAGSTTPEASTLPPRGSAAFLVNFLDLGGEVAACTAYAQGMLGPST